MDAADGVTYYGQAPAFPFSRLRGEEERLRATGSRDDERLSAVRDCPIAEKQQARMAGLLDDERM